MNYFVLLQQNVFFNMRNVVIILLSLILVAGCSKPEKKRIKLPTKVKVEVVDGERCNGAQQYVGIVEEQ